MPMKKEKKEIDCQKVPIQRDRELFTDSLLYKDSLEIVDNPSPEDSGNKDDVEPELEKNISGN